MGDAGAAFSGYLAHNLPRIDEAVAALCPRPTAEGAQDADLARYLYGPLGRFVSSGGKRTRPALCLLGAEAVGGSPQDALTLAASIELFQAAALIHDDIADDGQMRRGEPCVHVSEGCGIAINIGDAALVAVTDGIARDESLDPALRLRLLREVCAMEQRTLEGQALDLGWARDGRWDISVEDYLYTASHKTAYYSAATPLALGALCAGGSERQVEGLREFGMRCGLAFQIQDDLLNLVGDAAAQGKDFRSDITEGKRTLVMVYALAHLDGPDRSELVGLLDASTSDDAARARAVELAESAGAIDHARTYARDLVGRAKDGLRGLDVSQDAAQVLRSMADYFVTRSR